MILRNLIFQLEVIKQRLPTGLVSHHKQQASQCNGEQQHRWAAYNVNPAPAQASTEGLFQQTQAITLKFRFLSITSPSERFSPSHHQRPSGSSSSLSVNKST